MRVCRRVTAREKRRYRVGRAHFAALCLCFSGPLGALDASAQPAGLELGALSLEELANVEITSVSKRPEKLAVAPASIYVITQDDIRRDGAVSIPEILRLAPNLQVARINSMNYTISSRGFNSNNFANKLLVLIDGRTVYSNLHSGVFWDAQNTMLEDIERIEVVSGPGGTLWGANAVNGVINIITRNSEDTQGALLSSSYGPLDQRASARYGFALGDNVNLRVYGTGFKRSALVNAANVSSGDKWDGLQGGFRGDWKNGADIVTVQGDIYNEWTENSINVAGENILSRWNRDLGDGSGLQLQAYFDRTYRTAPVVKDTLDTYDVTLQHNFMVGPSHALVWGAGYRLTSDYFINGSNPFVLSPPARTLGLGNVFIQDQIALGETLSLTLGIKAERNDFTGFEYMPNARLAWQASSNTFLWSAVSRAERTPSRLDTELLAPGTFGPSPGFQSENVTAYELGYRGSVLPRTSVSLTAFYNDYSDLRSSAVRGGVVRFGNDVSGKTYGLEAWANFAATDIWRLSAGYSQLQQDLKPLAGTRDAASGFDPHYQFSLRSDLDLFPDLQLGGTLRAVGGVTRAAIPSYVECDARIAWMVTDRIELSLTGRDLLHNKHLEMVDGVTRLDVRRSVYLGARWAF